MNTIAGWSGMAIARMAVRVGLWPWGWSESRSYRPSLSFFLLLLPRRRVIPSSSPASLKNNSQGRKG